MFGHARNNLISRYVIMSTHFAHQLKLDFIFMVLMQNLGGKLLIVRWSHMSWYMGTLRCVTFWTRINRKQMCTAFYCQCIFRAQAFSLFLLPTPTNSLASFVSAQFDALLSVMWIKSWSVQLYEHCGLLVQANAQTMNEEKLECIFCFFQSAHSI